MQSRKTLCSAVAAAAVAARVHYVHYAIWLADFRFNQSNNANEFPINRLKTNVEVLICKTHEAAPYEE